MAPVPLAVAGEGRMTGIQYSAPVVWMDWRTVAILCPLCSTVEQNNLRQYGGEARQGFCLPETVMASCFISNVPIRIEPPKAKFEYNGKKGRFEAARPGSLEVVEDCRSTCEIEEDEVQEADDDVEFDARQLFEVESASSFRNDEVGNVLHLKTEFDNSIVSSGLASLLSTRVANAIEILAPLASKNGNQLAEPLASIKLSTNGLGKTVAILYRGEGFAPVIAVSGWKSGLSGCDYLLDQEKWGREVKKLQALVKHKSGWGRWRNKYEKGQEISSHAEKLAMAYFVRNRRTLSGAPLGEERGQEDQILREAWIALDREACNDCKNFKLRLERKFGVIMNFVIMRNELLEQKVIHRGYPKTPMKAHFGRVQTRTPAESRAKLRRNARESSYYQNKSCDDSYVDDGDDEESGDAIDDDTDEERGSVDDESGEDYYSGDDKETADEAETALETDELGGSLSPTPGRDMRARVTRSRHETRARGLRPAPCSEPIRNHVRVRKRARIETSSSSDTEFGERDPTPRPLSRPRRRRYQASLLRTTETEDDPFVENTSHLFTHMDTPSEETSLRQQHLGQKRPCRRFIWKREFGFLESGAVEDNEDHVSHEQGDEGGHEKESADTLPTTPSERRALFSPSPSHLINISSLNEPTAGPAPSSSPPSHPRNAKSNNTTTKPLFSPPPSCPTDETSLHTPTTQHPLVSAPSNPAPTPLPFYPIPPIPLVTNSNSNSSSSLNSSSNSTPAPTPTSTSTSTPFCPIPPILLGESYRPSLAPRRYNVPRRPRPRPSLRLRGYSLGAPSSVSRASSVSSSVARPGDDMSRRALRTASRKGRKNGVMIDLTRD